MFSQPTSFITILFLFFFGFFIGNGGVVKSDLIQTFISFYEILISITKTLCIALNFQNSPLGIHILDLNLPTLQIQEGNSSLNLTERSNLSFPSRNVFLNFLNEFNSFTLFITFLFLECTNCFFSLEQLKQKKLNTSVFPPSLISKELDPFFKVFKNFKIENFDFNKNIPQSSLKTKKNSMFQLSSFLNVFKTGFLFGIFVDAFKVGS
uniref:Hypothetical chloroplast RF20 n=1 Tax=Monomastix sp. (strain OKE-1) TaxID=141716 RepID=C0JWL7_MONSK|nr:hypothetical chloroplast RF20 [Monomastix sp. OKE-1]ACK36920.1 hypothetical chloroplast RF20 [Monomastix sp. OKE-1]